VAVYLVWSPQSGAGAQHVPDATRLIRDPRVQHFWDPNTVVGAAFAPAVGREAAAWDVWLLFERATRWTSDGPPVPAWWEHQLGDLPDERRLDARRFASRAMALGPAAP
jgi:hypothetical protein